MEADRKIRMALLHFYFYVLSTNTEEVWEKRGVEGSPLCKLQKKLKVTFFIC